MTMKREIRFLSGKVEVREITAEERALGYIGAVEGFIPFNSNSREMRDAKGRPFIERLAPGVFSRSLAEPGHAILADVGHSDAAIFARRGVNLVLEERADGLAYRALLPDTNAGRDLQTNARLGIIDGTSFEFEVRAEGGKRVGEEWSRGEAIAVRTIREAILHRVNPVSEPAYLGASLAARSAQRFHDLCAAGQEVRSYVPEVDDASEQAAANQTFSDTRLWESRVAFF